ncbi:MAG: cation transporter, partial [Ramlibacter sp.]|nr:cation transporter [Ramlibacter sp.]
MKLSNLRMKKESSPDCCAHDAVAAPANTSEVAPALPGSAVYRIPAMDCAVEEADIRRALEPIAAIRSLNFHIGARTLRITAPADQLPNAVQAIEKAGYKIELLTAGAGAGSHGKEGDDHDHGVAESPWRLGVALALAIAAEGLEFAGLGSTAWKAVIFLLAVAAIWLSGVEVYKKGVQAVLHLKLNINALMSVAV